MSGMTREEAINLLKHIAFKDDTGCMNEARNMAIADMEKQIPKKPIYSDFDDNEIGEIIPYKAECPVCGNIFKFGTWNDEENHHCKCGQKINWGMKGGAE